MFKPNKTAVAGLICGLFVTSVALAQDISLSSDVSYSFAKDGASPDEYALFQNKNLEGNNYNLTISTQPTDKYWTRLIVAQGQNITFSNIGTLSIEDHASRYSDGLIYAQNDNTLSLDKIGTLNVVSDEALPIQAVGGKVEVNADTVSLTAYNGNAIMVQPNAGHEAAVALNVSGDINIEATDGSAILIGALVDSSSTSLSLAGNNIFIVSKATSAKNAQFGVVLYDEDVTWNPGAPADADLSLSIHANNLLEIDGAYAGVYLSRISNAFTDSKASFSSDGKISIHGDVCGLYLSSSDKENSPAVEATVDAPVIDIASDNSSAVHLQYETSLTLGSKTRPSQISISSPAGQNAVKLASDTSKVTFTNSSVEIASGDVASSGTITLNDTRMDLSATSDFNTAVLAGASSEIVVNSAQTTVAAASNAIKDLRVLASGTYSDALGSPEAAREALASQLSINNAEGSDYLLGGEAGTVAGSWNETTDANGNKVIEATENASLEAIRQFNAMTLVQWRNENNHLSQRLGDVRAHRGALGTWARVYGYDSSVKDNINVDVKATSIQVGADTALGSNWIVGGAFSYTSMDGDFDNGSGESDGYSLAAYASGFFDCGGYVDVIGRVGRLSTDVTASTLSATGGVFSGSYDNTTLGLSVEAGYHWNPVSILYVEPQAELAYGYVLGDDFSSAANGVTIEQDDFQSLVGRLGARIGATLPKDAGQIYMHVSINHDFLGDADATARPSAGLARSISTDLGGTWVSYGLGMQFEAGQNLSIYGSLDRANGSDYQEDYRYSVGVRYVW